MATVRDIVTRSLRMAKVIGQGEMADGDELESGVSILQSMYDQWLIGGMFGRLNDRYEDGNYTAGAGQRIFVKDGTVTLPDYSDTQCRWRDLAAIEAFDEQGRKVWLWDRDSWVRLDGLDANSVAPLSLRGENGLAACHAILFADEFGGEVGNSIVMQARTFKYNLSLKMGSTQDIQPGVYF